jgi:ABC-type transporter Mla subunit MlaD
LAQVVIVGLDSDIFSAGITKTATTVSEIQKHLTQISTDIASLKGISDSMKSGANNMNTIGTELNAFYTAMQYVDTNLNAMNNYTDTGIAKALDAVKRMVAKAQEIEKALKSLPNIDIQARLGKVAKMVGFGANGKYTVDHGPVHVNINFKITMDAGKVERVILERKESIIRDRLNFSMANSNADTADHTAHQLTPKYNANIAVMRKDTTEQIP